MAVTEEWRKRGVLSRLLSLKSQALWAQKGFRAFDFAGNITGKNLISESSLLPPISTSPRRRYRIPRLGRETRWEGNICC